jgi:hypothetical protein
MEMQKLQMNTAVRSCGSECQTASPCVKQNLPVTVRSSGLRSSVAGMFQCIHASALHSHYRAYTMGWCLSKQDLILSVGNTVTLLKNVQTLSGAHLAS